MQRLINEQPECYIKFKTRGTAECFGLDKAKTSDVDLFILALIF